MQFNDIHFYENSDHNNAYGLLIKGVWVPKREFVLMHAMTQKSLPVLDWSKPQTSKSIYNNEQEWLSLPTGKRIALGRVLRFFAEKQIVPLGITNLKKKSGCHKYMRTDL